MDDDKKTGKKHRLVIQLGEKEREILDAIKAQTGASYSEIIRRMIAKEGAK